MAAFRNRTLAVTQSVPQHHFRLNQSYHRPVIIYSTNYIILFFFYLLIKKTASAIWDIGHKNLCVIFTVVGKESFLQSYNLKK